MLSLFTLDVPFENKVELPQPVSRPDVDWWHVQLGKGGLGSVGWCLGGDMGPLLGSGA